ncbi:MAG: HAMP domain-containing histidine kinase [Pedobacter sp.]|nr:MAG: HAMP domain-containing histidine kinase [Pedobacter sp.]
MIALFTYKTPQKFAVDFKEFYSYANLKQVKILSTTLLIVAGLARFLGTVFYEDILRINNYHAHSLNNWIQLAGASIFLLLSRWALRKGNLTYKQRRVLTLSFIVFILLISFGVSYTVSTYNTKNTLTMFLIGIVVVSLFFAIEYKEIVAIALSVIVIFVLSMVLPKITFEDKVMNIIAAFILAFILMCASRYSYYFKSQHFIQLKQLEEKNREIEHLNTLKGEILGFVAHDLRNPLNNIDALSSFMLMDDSDNTEAKMIADAAKQANNIINDLIEVVKHDELSLQTETVNLVNYISRIVQKWQKNSNRTIVLKAEETDLITQINQSKLERVIDNLISNGLKFSNEDQPVIISLSKRDNHVCIVVKDKGIGIPDVLLKHMFNQFTQAGRTGLKGEKSMGLGLHISKKIVEQHGGKLVFSSAENKGSTFTIMLPSD